MNIEILFNFRFDIFDQYAIVIEDFDPLSIDPTNDKNKI